MPTTVSTAAPNGRLWGSSAEDWANIQEKTCQPVYTAAFARLNIDTTTHLLDCGCGAGLATQLAAERGAHVSGIDAAENLLAIARTRVPSGDFRVSPIEQLPFADHTFNVVTGFNSFQYAADPVAALAEARRVAKPGAPILIMVWGSPEGMEAAQLLFALKPLLPPPPAGTPPPPGPFALSKLEALRQLATNAGLTPTDLFDVESPWHYASLEEAIRGLGSSGVSRRAIEHSGQEAVDKAHAEALAPFAQPDGTYKIGATFRCLIATA